MKKLISILTALLVVIVGNYSMADEPVSQDTPVRITKPKTKAQNGANDPEVRAEAEREKQREAKEAQRVTAADVGAYTQRMRDDHVVPFQRGREYITMVPFRDLHLYQERKEAFEAAQVYGEKLMVTWLRNAFNLRYPTTDEMVKQELNKLSAAQLRDLLKAHPNKLPTTDEILRTSQDAAEAMKRLKAQKKFLVEFDDLIAAFDVHQQEVEQNTDLKEHLKKAVPSGVLVVGSFKVPDTFLEAIKGIKVISGLSVLLKGTINFSLAVRPWKVIKRNMDTGVVTETFYFETIPQAWFIRELVSGQFEVRAPLRLGAGLLFGDFNKARDLNGATIGASYVFGATSSIGNGALPIPAYWNLRAGVITSTDEVKNSYITLTRQFGLTAPLQRKFVAEAGTVFSLASLTERVKIKSETLEDILALIDAEDPGTTITVTKGQPLETIAPQKPAPKPVESQQEIPAKP